MRAHDGEYFMIEVKVVTPIFACREDIWRDIARFSAWDQWHEAMSRYETQGAGEGAVRWVPGCNGLLIQELLNKKDDDNCRLVYSCAESPSGVKNYVSTIALRDVAGCYCQMLWAGTFDADGSVARAMRDYLHDFYQRGIGGLKSRHEIPLWGESARINLFRLLGPSNLPLSG
jgi:Polyketide cyclase / dehydrase and lipid transport